MVWLLSFQWNEPFHGKPGLDTWSDIELRILTEWKFRGTSGVKVITYSP